ncbi:hypothetical protein MJO29_001294 [Puccinia striiformis f. sp. tritici]|nr:hypothetical protein MJO29_001294 [Puccinia striiformis f. sp. tritici]
MGQTTLEVKKTSLLSRSEPPTTVTTVSEMNEQQLNQVNFEVHGKEKSCSSPRVPDSRAAVLRCFPLPRCTNGRCRLVAPTAATASTHQVPLPPPLVIDLPLFPTTTGGLKDLPLYYTTQEF